MGRYISLGDSSITIRPLEQRDIEPLHALYNRLVAKIPHHAAVGIAQFADQLTTRSWDWSPTLFSPAGEIALVAQRDGLPVAFVCGSFFCGEESDWFKAGTALLHLVFAEAQDSHACMALIQALLAHWDPMHPDLVLAMSYGTGPLFYGWGFGMVSSTWPSIGRCLTQAGFQTDDCRPKLHRALTGAPAPAVFPTGAQIHIAPGVGLGRHLGNAGEHEHSHVMRIGGEDVANCVTYLSERFIHGTGSVIQYVSYIHVHEAYRGRGFGRLLIQDALSAGYLTGASVALLYTAPYNFPAISVYQSLGFEVDDFLWEFKLVRQHT